MTNEQENNHDMACISMTTGVDLNYNKRINQEEKEE